MLMIARVAKRKELTLPWLALIIPIVLQIFISVLAFKDYALTETSVMQCINLTMGCLKVLLVLILKTLIFKSFGTILIESKASFSKYFSNVFIKIGIGIVFYTFSLFILGVVGALNAYVVSTLLILMAVVSFRPFIASLKALVSEDAFFSKFDTIGVILVFTLVSYLIINFISVQAPFPSGFDSKNVYINISNLIAGQGRLVSGFPPYNWSLFISTGFIMFDWVELGLSLSFYGYLLSIGIAYVIATERLQLSRNKSLFALLLVTVTPAITNQLHIELKVDYGLLFYQLLSLYVLLRVYNNIFSLSLKSKSPKVNLGSAVLILGVFVGFGLGIKMINMFLVMTLIALIWLNPKDLFGFCGALCFTLAALLIAQVDQVSGLGDYHLGSGYMKLIMMLLSIVFFAISFVKHRQSFTIRFTFTFGFLFVSGILISPWLVKNFIETKSLNPKVLFAGENAGIDLNTRKILKNYNDSKK